MAPIVSNGKPQRSSSSTLRTLRHHASTSSSSAQNTPSVAPKAISSLSHSEKILLRASKPLIKGRQFKWRSPAQVIASTKVDLSRIEARKSMLEPDQSSEALQDFNTTLFGTSLRTSSLINLSLPFIEFSRKVEKWSRSLPLVVHHRKEILEAIRDALKTENRGQLELCAETILDLIPSLLTDLSSLILPDLASLLTTLISLTHPSPLISSNPKLLQKVYDVLATIFKDLGKEILKFAVIQDELEEDVGGIMSVWKIVRSGLGAPKDVDEVLPEEIEMEGILQENDDVKSVEDVDENGDDEEEQEEIEEEEEEGPIASTSAAALDVLPENVQASKRGLPTNFRTTPQTRRLLGNAFAYLIRKARTSKFSFLDEGVEEETELEQLSRLFFEDLNQVELVAGIEVKSRKNKGKIGRAQEEGSARAFGEGLIWCLMEACTAPNSFLHSRTGAIIRSSLRALTSLEQGAGALPVQVLANVLTALATYAKSAEIYEPVLDEVVSAAQRFVDDQLRRNGEKDWERLDAMMKCVIAVVGTRKGDRVLPSSKPKLFALLQSYSSLVDSTTPGHFLRTYTTMTVAILLLASFQDVISGGAKSALDVLFTCPSAFAYGCALTLALDDVAWPHFSTSISHHILTTTATYLSEGAQEEDVEFGQLPKSTNALTLLARLAWSGRLRRIYEERGAVTSSWEKLVAEKCERLVRDWTKRSQAERRSFYDEVHQVLNALLVIPQLPSFRSSLLNAIVDLVASVSMTSSQKAREAFLESAANPAQILGAALLSISRCSPPDTDDVLTRLSRHLVTILEGFSWHRGVMQGIALLELAPLLSSTLNQNDRVFSTILPNLLSEDSILRLSSLNIAATLFKDLPVASDLIEKMLEVEKMPLSVQGAREKSMKIRKIGIVAHAQLGRDGEETDRILQILLRYLTVMFKVNFKPLWPEAIQALSLLSERFAEQVWSIASRQLIVVATRDASLYISRKPDWAQSLRDQSELNVVFEEPQLRDHQLEELQLVVQKESDLFETSADGDKSRDAALIEAQIAPERLVLQSYEAQLLQLFYVIPDLAQKHSREFVQVFLGCFQREDEDEADETIVRYVDPKESTKERQLRLRAWLAMFAKFSNPKALYRSSDLAAHFRFLLSFPDVEVQKLALDCILRWKTPAIVANAERLRNMLEPTKLRDELLQFVSGTAAGGLEPAHRPDVVPLFIRISYGIMTSRLGRASASSGQGRAGRRAAVLGALRTCSPEELDTLVDLAVGPLRKYIITKPEEPFTFASQSLNIPGKRQLGFLGFLADVQKHLGKHLVGRWHDLLGATLNLLYFAQKGIEAEAAEDDHASEVEAEEEGDQDVDEVETSMAPLRHIRQVALKRWAEFFRLEVDFDHTPYIVAAFPHIIAPRLPSLAAENAQAPSALLELFCTWSIRRDLLHHLVEHDSTLLPKLYGCLTTRNVKPAVILRIFDIVDKLLEFAAEDGGQNSNIGQNILGPGVQELLVQLGGLFAVTSSQLDAKAEVGQRQVTLLCALAPYVNSKDQAGNFLTLITPLLRKPNKTVPERTKTDLLKILTSLYPLARPAPSTPLYDRCCEVISGLFSSNRTRNARLQTVEAFSAIASVEPSFAPVAELVRELNSYSAKRSEEPDFDRRLAAFSSLNEDKYRTIKAADWIVIIHNMLFFIQDPEELAIRSNASFSLRRFIEVAGERATTDEEIKLIMTRVLLPGLRRALHSKLEIVRSEVLGVYASAVERCSGIVELDQLKCLLVDGDQEANFFYNIVHIQVHRRTRALRRLADEVEAGKISSKVVSDVFLPLLDHFILGSDGRQDSDLVNETVQCVARLSKHLAWAAYNKIVRHYLKFSKIAGSSQKACVRSVVGVLKGFHFDLLHDERLLDITTAKLLPEMQRYLEKRDEADEEVRIPVAEGISAVLQHLPVEPKTVHESALLMTLSQILRSKDQHVRDLARITIVNIVASSDSATIGVAVKELRRALQRGPQLHVLAFTVHAILVRLSDREGVEADVDDALDEIIPVLGDDCFGYPAKDRQSPEFRAKTKFREVRSFKSIDSFQILGKHVSPSKIASLLVPIRSTLQRTESAKVMKEVDDVFKALCQGLTTNEKLDIPGLLDLCHSLISANSEFLRPARVVPRKAGKNGKALPDFHVQLTRDTGDERDHFVKNAHRFVSFGLELFNTAFRKSQFDLDSPDILGRLEPLVALVGNTLYSDEPVVLARSMRATASLIRCPLTSSGNSAPVLVKQMIAIVQRSGSTESDLAQSSLRTLAGLIRDCKTVTLREDQLTTLLQLIGPDLEEADRQGTLFQLLRAIMARKFVAPEIYDLMDKVAEILVTNQSSSVREICRSIYLQFLLDYPQGRGRLKGSLTFLTKNLSFVHESGRLSVLELLNAILNKFATQLIQDASELFFIGLVLVIANDESTKCREMAAELVKTMFTRLPKDSRDVLISMLHTWADKQQQQPQLARTAIQLFGVAIDALAEDGRSIAPAILDVLGDVLDDSQERLEQAEESGDSSAAELDGAWQLAYQALQALSHVHKAFPDLVSPEQRSSRQLWRNVRGHLLFPHIWIRTSASRLLGSLYATSSASLARMDYPDDHPLSTASLLDAAQKNCLQLKSSALDEALAMQIVKNLFFAAKCFDARRSSTTAEEAQEQEGGEEEAIDEGEEHQMDPLRWLFTRLSYQARQAHIARPSMHAMNVAQWSLQPSSILRWFAAVISHLDKARLERFLIQMATPIFRISEDPNAQDPQMAELQSLAKEVQELLQTKVGTTVYANVHTKVRQRAAERRNERKTAMALQAINNPELDALRKAKRNEQKTRQKKRKNSALADQKGRFGKRSRRDD